MMELAEDGLLERCVAMGTFVKKRPLQKNRPFCIGVFVPDFTDAARMRALQGVAEACAAADSGLRVYCTHGGLRAAEALRLMDGGVPEEAFVLLGNGREATLTLTNTLDAHGLPVAEMLPGDNAAAVVKRQRAAE